MPLWLAVSLPAIKPTAETKAPRKPGRASSGANGECLEPTDHAPIRSSRQYKEAVPWVIFSLIG